MKRAKAKKVIGRVETGIPGFDELVRGGFEKRIIVLISGGTGTGKTNFCVHFIHHGATKGDKGLYISFEESPEQIKKHSAKFGLNFENFERKDKVRFLKMDVFKIARSIEASMLKAKGELMIRMKGLPTIIPRDFKPDRIVLDPLSALSAVFKKQTYRYFVFNLFSQLKNTGATTLIVSETRTEPAEYSRTGIEEFLADGVIVLYNIKHGDARLRALEVLKLRGSDHVKRIVPFKISNRGMIVYPKQSILTALTT